MFPGHGHPRWEPPSSRRLLHWWPEQGSHAHVGASHGGGPGDRLAPRPTLPCGKPRSGRRVAELPLRPADASACHDRAPVSRSGRRVACGTGTRGWPPPPDPTGEDPRAAADPCPPASPTAPAAAGPGLWVTADPGPQRARSSLCLRGRGAQRTGRAPAQPRGGTQGSWFPPPGSAGILGGGASVLQSRKDVLVLCEIRQPLGLEEGAGLRAPAPLPRCEGHCPPVPPCVCIRAARRPARRSLSVAPAVVPGPAGRSARCAPGIGERPARAPRATGHSGAQATLLTALVETERILKRSQRI